MERVKEKGNPYTSILSEAREAREKAYAPYSQFFVGAAVETPDGKIFAGSNVENASYGGSVCAERIAIFKAVNQGFTKFFRVLVVTDAHGKAVAPCGMCLQVMSEFCGPDTEIILATPERVELIRKFAEFLPNVFTKENLPRLKW